MKKAETKFAERVDRNIKALPGSCWFNIQQLSLHGTPDRLGVIKGRFIALELKPRIEDSLKSNKTVSLQTFFLGKVNHCGGYATFLYPENFEKVMSHLSRISLGVDGITPESD